jgi:hypothetical protein
VPHDQRDEQPKLEWVKPEVRLLAAGWAEGQTGSDVDAVLNQS